MTPVSSQEYIVPKIIPSHFRDLGERTSMGSTELNLFFTSSVLLLLPLIVAQQPVVLNLDCISNEGNKSMNNSTYHANLNSLFTSFSRTLVDYGFYAAGNYSDTVNAFELCRPDLVPDACRSCMKNSSDYLGQQCPNSKEGNIYCNICMLRYSNRSISGSRESRPPHVEGSSGNFSDTRSIRCC